jgi:hypothetical protein
MSCSMLRRRYQGYYSARQRRIVVHGTEAIVQPCKMSRIGTRSIVCSCLFEGAQSSILRVRLSCYFNLSFRMIYCFDIGIEVFIIFKMFLVATFKASASFSAACILWHCEGLAKCFPTRDWGLISAFSSPGDAETFFFPFLPPFCYNYSFPYS